MKKKYEKIIDIGFLILYILNLIFNLFLLIHQIYQSDKIIYTIIKFIIFIIIGYISYIDKYFIKHKKTFNIACVIFLCLILIQGINLYNKNNIYVIGNVECNNKNRYSLFYYDGYRYYSSCSFNNVSIKIGEENYSIYEIVRLRKDKINYLVNKFDLKKVKEKKEINVKINDNNNPMFIKTLLSSNYYYYGIEKIELIYNGEKYNLKDIDYPLSVEHFLDLKKIDENYNVLYEGEYYNMIACFKSYKDLVNSFIIPLSMDVNDMNNFCHDRKIELLSNSTY